MDFALTDEQQMIAETAKQFFEETATSERTRKAMHDDGFDRDTWQAYCRELGLGGLLTAEEYGGSALGLVEFATVAEAAGAQVAAIPLLGQTMASAAIAAGGSDAQKTEWLPKLASGETIAALAMADDIDADGDTISGTLNFVPHGHIADIIVLCTRPGAWIISNQSDGFSVSAPTTMDQTRPLARIELGQISAEALSDAAAARAAAYEKGIICLSAEALGGAEAALSRTCAYAMEREQFGRPIGSFQAYKHRLADMMIEIEQARSAVYWAACAADEGDEEAEMALYAAKSFCADTYFKCAGDMIQLHGGIGFTWEHDAHLFFKRARSIQTLLNAGHWHREKVATMILGEAA